MTITLDQIRQIAAGDTETLSVDLTSELESTESLAVVTATPSDATALTVANARVNDTAYTDRNRLDVNGDYMTVAVGKAVQLEVTAADSIVGPVEYTIDLEMTTDASQGHELNRRVRVVVV